ncbi:MAG: DUF4833 domain-containing protein [Endomicrobium sp.]|jgi:hypothetical protein|nr:DUF4833 domain-containing protein [Endomicrobium sp.]
MKKSKIILFLILVLEVFTVTDVPIVYGQITNKNLFNIKRNKNANVVMYDIRLDPNDDINKLDPIDVYWILYDKQGQRSEIKAFEKKVYGVKVKYNTEGYYNLILKAVPDKNMKVVLLNGQPKVLIKINNKDAYLSSVFVYARDKVFPKILYYTLTGIDVENGLRVMEKVILH